MFLVIIWIKFIMPDENKVSTNEEDTYSGCCSCLGCLCVVFFIIPMICFVISAIFFPEDLKKVMEEEKTSEKIEVIKNETHNGIAFKIVGKRITNEFALRQAGIQSTGDSLVLIVNVEVKNNGKEPYYPTKMRVRLLDADGAIYEGGTYRNLVEIVNSRQNVLNPGLNKVVTLFFKIPENKNFTIEFQDGTFFSDTVSIKL